MKWKTNYLTSISTLISYQYWLHLASLSTKTLSLWSETCSCFEIANETETFFAVTNIVANVIAVVVSSSTDTLYCSIGITL